ncbi:hypothetical protein [Amniculibacterium aquaticum]|uniref:hypothetical protein n=1 Tax=Amniculibacterium aquaticum TaxID=2479858 RepID=UPI000F5AB79B|nr:hypothetical protein [Amniculibacterium aquaticum]
MKKWISYILIVVYLFTFSEVKQLLKIPNLIEHYFTHSQKDSSTTIFSFLKMHYLEDHGKDADYKEDMKLPFKTHDNQCHAISSSTTTPPKSFEFSFENHFYAESTKSNFGYIESITSQKIHSVFRPPVRA